MIGGQSDVANKRNSCPFAQEGYGAQSPPRWGTFSVYDHCCPGESFRL